MIKTITIRQWKDLLKLEVEWPMDVYRGQANADWTLETAYRRALVNCGLLREAADTEHWVLRDFRRGAGRYLTRCPDETDYIGWLSLMQHHGTPTRLLDFTRSFYVACYFSLMDATGDSVVWAVDPFYLYDVMDRVFDVERQGLRDEWDDLCVSKSNEYLATLLKTGNSYKRQKVIKGIVPVQPFNLHERLSAQQGLFLMPLDVELDFLANLQPFWSKGEYPIKKMVLKRQMRLDALAHLREMNITAETLFPGIDGFARSLLHRQMVI